MLMEDVEAIHVADKVRGVVVRFADGVEKTIQVGENQTILDAAKEQGVRLVHQCLTGSCGTCIAKVEAGSVRMSTGRGTCLLPSEAAEGYRLTCTSFADSDAVIAMDYPSTILDEPEAKRYTAQVLAMSWVANNVVKLELALPGDHDFIFRSGQFVRVKVPGTEEWRSYSMASTTADLPTVVLLLRVLDDGVMSNYLRSRCAVGDAIEMEGPFGVFYLREAKVQHILVAGGTGLAPMLGMLEDIRTQTGRKPKTLLSFGCATEANCFLLDELEVRQAWMPNLKVKVSVASPGSEYRGLVGNPVEVIGATDVTDPEAVAYLCGPPAMIEAARAHLEKLGVKPENIHAEHFSASAT